jgi:hypothetical protein
MPKQKLFTPWSSLDNMLGKLPSWWPEEEQPRIASYDKYDEMYWNDPTQYAVRVLEGEQPLYIPNARTIVDTTSFYLMKGLKIRCPKKGANDVDRQWLDDLLKREKFYSTFDTGKLTGVPRGDWAFHITADPKKPEGRRISIELVHPGNVWKVYDDWDPDKLIRIHLVKQFILPNDPNKIVHIRKLTYEKITSEAPGSTATIWREEAIWKIQPQWWGPEPERVQQILPREQLPAQIDEFPVYWFKNKDWQGQDYGSSELRGLEFLEWAVSQGATDTEMALALEGLGVYATDGGRPVDSNGDETDWEVSPGKVMEVPQGSYFRRVEGVGSITPMMDQLEYLEGKMREASALSDVALGRVTVQEAESGIALAIKFMPTLAKIEARDGEGLDTLEQMWFNLRAWFDAYESYSPEFTYDITIAESKLPINRDAILNELNNMLDRQVISIAYYRTKMEEFGYEFPSDMDAQIAKEQQEKLARSQIPGAGATNADGSPANPASNLPPGSQPNNGQQSNKQANNSNNQTKTNESSGTESTQTTRRQARGGRP